LTALEQALLLTRKAEKVFAERGIPNARLDAELLLAHVLEIDRLKLYLQHDRPVTPPEVERFREFVRRRMKREPVQYIVGEVTFRKLDLAVDRRALIPRPETELLVGEVLKYPESIAGSALDIGTGTGAIALSLAHEGGCRVVATDVSAEALSLAGENAARTGLSERIELRQGATWDPIGADERFGVIVSNPPYVAEQERDTLQPEVAEYEPAAALFAPDAGLAVLWSIIERAHAHLSPGGVLALEIGNTQGAAVLTRIRESGNYGAVRVVRDYAGRDRIVIAEAAS
jgi:release factor glutamine methyltransferase